MIEGMILGLGLRITDFPLPVK